jgi:hypothetical protein
VRRRRLVRPWIILLRSVIVAKESRDGDADGASIFWYLSHYSLFITIGNTIQQVRSLFQCLEPYLDPFPFQP